MQPTMPAKQTVKDTEGTMTFDLTNNSTFNSNIYKINSNENKIYIRVAAKTEGVINYSNIVAVNTIISKIQTFNTQQS